MCEEAWVSSKGMTYKLRHSLSECKSVCGSCIPEWGAATPNDNRPDAESMLHELMQPILCNLGR